MIDFCWLTPRQVRLEDKPVRIACRFIMTKILQIYADLLNVIAPWFARSSGVAMGTTLPEQGFINLVSLACRWFNKAGLREMKAVMTDFGAKLHRKSIAAVAVLENRLPLIMFGWVAFVTLAGVVRTIFAVSPINSGVSFVQTVMPYILLGAAPIAAYWIANQVFPRGTLMQQR